MKRQNVLKVLFLSLIVSTLTSSCGLIEKWKTPEQPTDSKATEASGQTTPAADDLFSKTMNETKEETALNAGTDAPSNISSRPNEVKDDLKSLEDEFSGNAQAEVAKSEIQEVKVEESLPQFPEIKEELPATITDNPNLNVDAGKVMSYKVQKGETLMQIAFKIYGDLSKWKDIKNMNGAKLGGNSALRSGMDLKYTAPEKNFVWNPQGNPHMIKNGETLGTISNSVYQTPKKWKSIWENNKPLIKNPNLIYAGFTLYYKGDSMANYVQPKAIQKKITVNEDAKVDEAISNLEVTSTEHEAEIDLTNEVQSAPIRDINEEVQADEQMDEVLTE